MNETCKYHIEKMRELIGDKIYMIDFPRISCEEIEDVYTEIYEANTTYNQKNAEQESPLIEMVYWDLACLLYDEYPRTEYKEWA
ncbi:MAG: hypothetical protein PHO93_02430 [Candidatus Saccharimonadaceae bacterium]|nr:hypothetical protein [Candidatus Saccharimonadaceae bacterium]